MIARLSGRYGWRGLWLITIGLMWGLVGLGVLLQPNAPRSGVLIEYVPGVGQAAAWWITGAIAVWQGMRGAEKDDTVGHVALYLMPAVRVTSFLLSWILWEATPLLRHAGFIDGPIGFRDGWFAALVWGITSTALIVAAGWPNPEPPIPSPPASALEDT